MLLLLPHELSTVTLMLLLSSLSTALKSTPPSSATMMPSSMMTTNNDHNNSKVITTCITIPNHSNNEKYTYTIRPYDSSRDESSMREICKDVWNGTDYLPSKAKEFEEDELCDFVVMINEEDEVVGLGNRRIIVCDDDNVESEGEGGHSCYNSRISWIEAIRTSTNHQGKGIATALTKGLICRSEDDGITHVMSCTVDGNMAMKKIFERVGLKKTHEMQRMDFGVMKTLPGWSSECSTTCNENTQQAQPETILKALGVEHLIDESSRSTRWTTVKDESELKQILKDIENGGGLGYLPGIGKPHFFGPQLRSYLGKGLIRKKVSADSTPCVYGLIQDTAIQSLKSKWVCCIAALDSRSLGAALWDACSDKMIERRVNEVAFATMIDGAMVSHREGNASANTLIDKLAMQADDPFNLYSTK